MFGGENSMLAGYFYLLTTPSIIHCSWIGSTFFAYYFFVGIGLAKKSSVSSFHCIDIVREF